MMTREHALYGHPRRLSIPGPTVCLAPPTLWVPLLAALRRRPGEPDHAGPSTLRHFRLRLVVPRHLGTRGYPVTGRSLQSRQPRLSRPGASIGPLQQTLGLRYAVIPVGYVVSS